MTTFFTVGFSIPVFFTQNCHLAQIRQLNFLWHRAFRILSILQPGPFAGNYQWFAKMALKLYLRASIHKTGILAHKFTKNMGRPPILPKKKKDGWYIEVRNKGAKSGMILIRDTEVAMFQAAKQYETTKDVLILGEHRSGKRVDEKKIKKTKV
jgi:hypothetical protein